MAKVFTGPKGSLKINGAKIAFISDVQITETNDQEPIAVLDQLEVAENAEISHIVSFTCSLFKIDGNSATSLGLRPDNISDILTQPELTMEIFNEVDGRVEYTMSGVKWKGGSGSLSAQGVWQGSWEFSGVRGSGTI